MCDNRRERATHHAKPFGGRRALARATRFLLLVFVVTITTVFVILAALGLGCTALLVFESLAATGDKGEGASLRPKCCTCDTIK
jgi:hypothetical protein